ncbi:hypothetical protein BD779DRAFT_919926 [Infundibulicybe gibba]|nr:hypothetical protein BD779DRAFT_919926 [Infundibulicybe gibba]
MPCPNCGCCSCRALIGSPISAADRFSLPPSELTTTNLAPANSEVMHSRDVIRSAEGTVPLIQAMIDDLERRKAELLSLIRVHKAISSPLRSFPLELLATIFAEFITITRYSYPRRSSPLLLLMSICSRWRTIVLETPQLWTRIWGAPPAINSWIARSRELPLHLELELDSPDLYPVLEALVPHAHRWERVRFSCAGLNSLLVLERVRTHLHSLKTLHLHFGSAAGTIDFCEVAPQLTDVGLTGIYGPIIIKLPWEQLRSCTLDNSEFALDVLQRARNLQTCRLVMTYITVDNIGAWSSTPGDPHSCPGLDTLIVCWSTDDPNINTFFSSITLPSLRTLEIDFDSDFVMSDSDYDDCSDLDDLDDSDHTTADQSTMASITMSRFFGRSSTHLNTLTLIGIPFSSSGLADALHLHLPLFPSRSNSMIGIQSTMNFYSPYISTSPGISSPAFAPSPYEGEANSLRRSWMPSSPHGGILIQQMTGSPCSRT